MIIVGTAGNEGTDAAMKLLIDASIKLLGLDKATVRASTKLLFVLRRSQCLRLARATGPRQSYCFCLGKATAVPRQSYCASVKLLCLDNPLVCLDKATAFILRQGCRQ